MSQVVYLIVDKDTKQQLHVGEYYPSRESAQHTIDFFCGRIGPKFIDDPPCESCGHVRQRPPSQFLNAEIVEAHLVRG